MGHQNFFTIEPIHLFGLLLQPNAAFTYFILERASLLRKTHQCERYLKSSSVFDRRHSLPVATWQNHLQLLILRHGVLQYNEVRNLTGPLGKLFKARSDGLHKTQLGSPIFYTCEMCRELENSLSYCVNACKLCRSKRAFSL